MKDQRVYLEHIQEAIAAIRSYTIEGRSKFMASTMVQDAVIRNLEIVGEATKQLDDSTRSLRPDIPWRRIAGMRDVLIHNYMGVDADEVWHVVEHQLPLLDAAIEAMLRSLNASDGN